MSGHVSGRNAQEFDFLDHVVAVRLIFEKLPNCFLWRLYHWMFPPAKQDWSSFSKFFLALLPSLFFNSSHSDRCMMLSYYGLNSNFSSGQWCWTSFHVTVCMGISSVVNISLFLLPTFEDCLLFYSGILRVLSISSSWSFVRCAPCKYSLLLYSFSFYAFGWSLGCTLLFLWIVPNNCLPIHRTQRFFSVHYF